MRLVSSNTRSPAPEDTDMGEEVVRDVSAPVQIINRCPEGVVLGIQVGDVVLQPEMSALFRRTRSLTLLISVVFVVTLALKLVVSLSRSSMRSVFAAISSATLSPRLAVKSSTLSTLVERVDQCDAEGLRGRNAVSAEHGGLVRRHLAEVAADDGAAFTAHGACVPAQ